MDTPKRSSRTSLRAELAKRSETSAIPGVSIRNHFWVLLPMLLIPIFVPTRTSTQLFLLVVIAGAIVFVAPLSMLWVRTVGPPIANETLKLERIRNRRVLLYVAGGSLSALITLFVLIDDSPEWILAAVLLVELVVFAWVRPAMAVAPILLAAALVGSVALLVAAPLTVMLARRDQRVRLGLPGTVRRAIGTVGAAGLAFLLTLPFANTSAGSPPERSMSDTAPTSPTSDGSLLRRVVRWLQGGGSESDFSVPSRPVNVPGAAPEALPDDPTRWWLWALVAAGIAVIAFVVWWLLRRRRHFDPPAPAGSIAEDLVRLEAIGRSVGRPRSSAEGAISFADGLRSHTGDDRLPSAGALVSGSIYGSASVNRDDVADHLAHVEANPPPAPPKPSLRTRARDRVTRVPISRRGLAVGMSAVIALGALAWLSIPRLSDLRNDGDRELAFARQDDAPPIWEEVHALPGADLVGWQQCAADPSRPGESRMAAAVESRAERLGAIHSSTRQFGGAEWSSLRVGTDQMSATTYVGLNATTTSSSDGWRISQTPLVPLGAFATVDDVLRTTAVREPIRTEFMDRNGESFVRFESLPPEWDVVYGNGELNSPISVDPSQMMVVDIWVDGNDVPVRVRMIGNGPEGDWTEWRRVANVDSAADGLTLPKCELQAPYANADWIGLEPWEPTRWAPLLVSFDQEGNPYDSYGWEGEPPTIEDGGSIAGPIPVLTVGDLYSMWVDGGGSQPVTFELDWQQGADLVLVRDDEGYPVATRIDAADPSGSSDGRLAVVRWDEVRPFDVYESFVTAIVADRFPLVDYEKLDELVEPLWDGRNHVAADVDGDSHAELTFMTQSNATAIVSGRDETGAIVSVVVLDDWFEWRRIGFEGTPPPSVLEREAELSECIAGERNVDRSGRCVTDSD